MAFSSLTRDRVFGEDQIAKDDFPRLQPACDPPLKAGFVFLGARLLANHLEHSAPTRARSQFIRAAEKATSRAELEQQAPALLVLQTYLRPSSTPRPAASQFGGLPRGASSRY